MSSAKILLIGDEPNILRTLRRNLTGRGYEVNLALDDLESIEMASSASYDLFVLNLDFAAVDADGLAVCSGLRKQSHSPIIVISAVGSEKAKIQALDLGADDYLVLPFSMEEFLARVRSSLRRWFAHKAGPAPQQNIILAGNLLVDRDARQVAIRGEQVHLTPTEYGILLYLAERMGKVVTHRELLKGVWGTQYGDEREYLRVYISQLRRKVEDDSLNPLYILTEPGVGYRFVSDF